MEHTPVVSAKVLALPMLYNAPIPAVTRILSQFPAEQLANFIEVAIGLLDLASPPDEDEPDFASRSDGLPGDPADHEPTGDDEPGAYAEWSSLRGDQRKIGTSFVFACGHEDDEDDDPEDGEITEDEPTFKVRNLTLKEGPGCPIADPGGCEHDGREPEDDSESEQMLHDVPALRVHSLKHNVFTDERVFLGVSNLMSSYRADGDLLRSADSGALLKTSLRMKNEPGIPV